MLCSWQTYILCDSLNNHQMMLHRDTAKALTYFSISANSLPFLRKICVMFLAVYTVFFFALWGSSMNRKVFFVSIESAILIFSANLFNLWPFKFLLWAFPTHCDESPTWISKEKHDTFTHTHTHTENVFYFGKYKKIQIFGGIFYLITVLTSSKYFIWQFLRVTHKGLFFYFC